MIAELLQSGYMRADRRLVREYAYCFGSALDRSSACARSLKTDKDHLVTGIRQALHQVVQNASSGDHAAGRDNDAGIVDLIDLFGVFLLGREVKALPVQWRSKALDQLPGFVVELAAVFHENLNRFNGHGAVNKYREAWNLAAFHQIFYDEKKLLGALNGKCGNNHAAAAVYCIRDQ